VGGVGEALAVLAQALEGRSLFDDALDQFGGGVEQGGEGIELGPSPGVGDARWDVGAGAALQQGLEAASEGAQVVLHLGHQSVAGGAVAEEAVGAGGDALREEGLAAGVIEGCGGGTGVQEDAGDGFQEGGEFGLQVVEGAHVLAHGEDLGALVQDRAGRFLEAPPGTFHRRQGGAGGIRQGVEVRVGAEQAFAPRQGPRRPVEGVFVAFAGEEDVHDQAMGDETQLAGQGQLAFLLPLHEGDVGEGGGHGGHPEGDDEEDGEGAV